jgi:hypothetical protein
MYIDSLLEFSDAQAVTSSAASANVIDLSSDKNIGPGTPLYVVLTVDTAIAGTSPTVDADIQTDTVENFASPTVIGSFEQITDSNGTQGAQFVLGFPFTNQRYLRLNYTAGGTVSAGAVSAHLTDQQPPAWEALPNAID